MGRTTRGWWVLALALCAGCGDDAARSDSDIGSPPARDAIADDAEAQGDEAPLDASSDAEPACSSDCDDGIECTDDRCVGSACTHAPDPALCTEGETCDATTGCVAVAECTSDGDCRDDNGCTVGERCDTTTSRCAYDLPDNDHDGESAADCGGTDCNDRVPEVRPGATESCNGRDDDCDGVVDGAAANASCPPGRSCESARCTCPPELPLECPDGCFDLLTDPSHCLTCDTVCPTSEHGRAFCNVGVCALECDEGFHPCADGCFTDDDVTRCGAECVACPMPQNGSVACVEGSCEISCDAGYHRCGEACVANASVDSCGDRCSACPVPTNGRASCDGVACGVECDAGFHACAGTCARNTDPATCGTSCTPCSVPTGSTATCDGSNCGIACFPGRHQCGDACLLDTSPSSCGTSCTPCPTVPNSTATCGAAGCGIACNPGHVRVGDSCIPGPTCNAPYTYGGHLYVICNSTRRTWNDAGAYCASFPGWHLATIESAAENDEIMWRVSEEAWIGLSDLASEGTYRWGTGPVATYTDWCSGEPNNQFGDENCVLMARMAFYCGSCMCWNDEQCYLERGFVCEYDGSA